MHKASIGLDSIPSYLAIDLTDELSSDVRGGDGTFDLTTFRQKITAADYGVDGATQLVTDLLSSLSSLSASDLAQLNSDSFASDYYLPLFEKYCENSITTDSMSGEIYAMFFESCILPKKNSIPTKK